MALQPGKCPAAHAIVSRIPGGCRPIDGTVHALRVSALGVCIGLPLALAIGRLSASQLYRISSAEIGWIAQRAEKGGRKRELHSQHSPLSGPRAGDGWYKRVPLLSRGRERLRKTIT